MKKQKKKVARAEVKQCEASRRIRETPVSANWGVERGTPLGRFFVDRFMESRRKDITGVVLEIKNKRYTDSLGYDVKRDDVLDVDASNLDANIIADLAKADAVPSDTYDCFMVNETMQFVYDLQSAVNHIHRILKPGGVLLVTVPCTVQHDRELKDVEMWRFTKPSCERLFGDVFGADQVEVETYGNFVTCNAALTGIVVEELESEVLEEVSDTFVQGICVRAQKAPLSASS
jgi:SAM-dependent methyltransferase